MIEGKLALFTHPDCFGHQPNDEHPESPDRLRAVLDSLKVCAPLIVTENEARLAKSAELARAHTREMIANIFHLIPRQGLWALDDETIVSSGSGQAALRAAGACLSAVEYCLREQGSFAFCAIRPPGHHATRTEVGGFCLFNNVAIAALAALEHNDIKKIAILDFDVHHGNGTQDTFWDDKRVLFASMHEQLQDPKMGLPSQTGAHNNIINIQHLAGEGGKEWLGALQETILPRFKAFAPDMLFISAGFDAHISDPLAETNLTDADYNQMGTMVGAFVRSLPLRGVITALEGGYNLDALPRAACAFLTGLVTISARD